MDCTPEELRSFYKHCESMLNSTDRKNPGRNVVYNQIQNQKDRCTTELFLRWLNSERNISKYAFLNSIREFLENNPQIDQQEDKLSKVISVENSEDVRSAVVELAKEFLLRDNMDDSVRSADFTQYGKDGVKLSYSREQFIADIKSVISTLPEEQQKAILEKIEIEFVGQNITPVAVRTVVNTDPMSVELSVEEASAEKKGKLQYFGHLI